MCDCLSAGALPARDPAVFLTRTGARAAAVGQYQPSEERYRQKRRAARAKSSAVPVFPCRSWPLFFDMGSLQPSSTAGRAVA